MKSLMLIPGLAVAAALSACASGEHAYNGQYVTPLNGAEQQVLVGAAAGTRLPDGSYAGTEEAKDSND